MILESGLLTEEALSELAKNADLIQCECPTHLIVILHKLRDFQSYTTDCISRFPEDAATHVWLQASAKNLDAMLSNTIVQLARMEGFIDADNNFTARKTPRSDE